MTNDVTVANVPIFIGFSSAFKYIQIKIDEKYLRLIEEGPNRIYFVFLSVEIFLAIKRKDIFSRVRARWGRNISLASHIVIARVAPIIVLWRMWKKHFVRRVSPHARNGSVTHKRLAGEAYRLLGAIKSPWRRCRVCINRGVTRGGKVPQRKEEVLGASVFLSLVLRKGTSCCAPPNVLMSKSEISQCTRLVSSWRFICVTIREECNLLSGREVDSHLLLSSQILYTEMATEVYSGVRTEFEVDLFSPLCCALSFSLFVI